MNKFKSIDEFSRFSLSELTSIKGGIFCISTTTPSSACPTCDTNNSGGDTITDYDSDKGSCSAYQSADQFNQAVAEGNYRGITLYFDNGTQESLATWVQEYGTAITFS